MKGLGVEVKVAVTILAMMIMMANYQARGALPYEICYAECFATCVMPNSLFPIPLPLPKPLRCAAKCAAECLNNSYERSVVDGYETDPNYYYKLGCAMEQCVREDIAHDAKKMGNCVESCSSNHPCLKKKI